MYRSLPSHHHTCTIFDANTIMDPPSSLFPILFLCFPTSDRVKVDEQHGRNTFSRVLSHHLRVGAFLTRHERQPSLACRTPSTIRRSGDGISQSVGCA